MKNESGADIQQGYFEPAGVVPSGTSPFQNDQSYTVNIGGPGIVRGMFRFSDPGPSAGNLTVTAWVFGTTTANNTCLFSGHAIVTNNRS